MRWAPRKGINRREWHKFFAWVPEYVESADRFVWLETLERRATVIQMDYVEWEYRLPSEAMEA